MSGKSNDYLSWEDYFMASACLAAQRSKDPTTKVGACIVNKDRRIVAMGYNGMPNGCDDDDMPWERDGPWAKTKYPYVCHAEMNAIMNKTSADLVGCTIYTTLFPCNECAKLIIQSGIRNVCYLSDKHHDRESSVASRSLLNKASIKYSQHTSRARILIDLQEMYKKPNDIPAVEVTKSSSSIPLTDVLASRG